MAVASILDEKLMLWHCPVVLNVRKQNITLFYPSLTRISLFASPNLLPLLLKVDQNPSKEPNDQLGIDGSEFRPGIPIYVAAMSQRRRVLSPCSSILVTLPSLPRRPIGDTLLAGLLTPRVEEAKYNFVYGYNPVKDLYFMFLYNPDKLLTKHGPPSADQR